MGDTLKKTDILPHLKTAWLGRNYHYFPEIGSTNSELRRRYVTEALPAGTLFVTDFQAAGKGRLARKWVVPANSSLLLSLLLNPKWPAEKGQWLTMIGCLAVINAVKSVTGLTVKIKWPNDLMLDVENEWRKFAGILVEGEMADGMLETAVYGMGVNVNISKSQLPEAKTAPTSLMIASGQKVDRVALLISFLTHFEAQYEKAMQGESPHEAWRQELITLGQPVEVAQLHNRTVLRGTAVDIDSYGRLKVQDDLGEIHLIYAGDVSLRGHFDN